MPYQTSWYIENRVVACQMQGDLNSDELVGCSNAIEQLVSGAALPLILIVDQRAVTKVSANVNHALDAMKGSPARDRIAWFLLISDSRFYNFLGTMASQFFGLKLRVMSTPEEADAFIAHQAPELVERLSQPEA